MADSDAELPPIPELTEGQQGAFDALLEDAIEALPAGVRALLDQVPVVVMDEPTPEMVATLQKDGTLLPEEDGLDLCGLHTGVGITDRSVDDPAGWGFGAAEGGGPEQIHLFRRGICDLAGGWGQEHADQEIYEEIRITLLHEIGHHFGLDEDDLDELGYA